MDRQSATAGMGYAPPPDTGLAPIHADADIVVLDKPHGLLSVPGKTPDLADCLERRARLTFPDARTVHRLDRDTSGVLVMARTACAQRHLGLQFERRKVTKIYEAVVEGVVDADLGLIDLPLTADWPRRPMQKVCHKTGRVAVTRWSVISRAARSTRVRLQPETGRSHQLRVHLRELGHPILGDPLYGSESSAQRMMLHARSLELRHPADGRRVVFMAPMPF